MQRALRLERVVVVQPSPYGTDNACTVDALRRLGDRARGVAVVDGETGDAALRELHAAGVRGVRVNLETAGVDDPAIARARLEVAAARVAPLGWHVQTYTNLAVLAALHDALLALPATLVVDHFGRARAAAGVGQPGFDALLSLVRHGNAYVKLSAAYRVSERADWADVAPLARALIEANPDRMLWGSDWPHPGGSGGPRRPDVVEPFWPVDDGLALNRLRQWTSSPAQLHRILVENPRRLYGF